MHDTSEADVCLIVEGAYPYVVGGVSTWLQDLILGLPDLRFRIVAIKAVASDLPWKLDPPPNVLGVTEISLGGSGAARRMRGSAKAVRLVMERTLDFLDAGTLDKLRDILRALSALQGWQAGEVLGHPAAFEAMRQYGERRFGSVSFHHYFWAVRTLALGLLAILVAPVPPARLYHTISTGFAGLLVARMRIERERPAAITEHGIYLIEREIEILMADWIGDQIDTGLALDRDAHDLRDLWRRAFDSYARTCYAACDPIIALYGANSSVQHRLGAPADRLQVIPNGIDLATFATLPNARDPARPTVALIGRVVPIKDVKTFIRAAALVHARVPSARFVILGPCDEDADYAEECRTLATDLGLTNVLTFEGRVAMADWLPRIDLVVLTSLSEAQPLVILEAGSNGIPVVAPDVGSCREMIEGKADGASREAGGIITNLVDPPATAAAIEQLLSSPDQRRQMGQALKARIKQDFARDSVLSAYREVYLAGRSRSNRALNRDRG